MILLEKPSDDSGVALQACMSGIRKLGAKPRFLSYEQGLLEEVQDFEDACSLGEHRAFTSKPFTEDLKKDMIWLYDNRLLKAVAARPIYDRLILLAPRRVCPICHLAIADTLDHCLPKSSHPRLAVTPLNLVPACSACNLSKRTESSGGVNLYLDGWIDQELWLEAKVSDPRLPESVEFFVGHPGRWSNEQQNAVVAMFDSCNLAKRYAVCAASEFRSAIFGIQKVLHAGTMDDVNDMLSDAVESAAADRSNGWKHAAYRAWLSVVDDISWLGEDGGS